MRLPALSRRSLLRSAGALALAGALPARSFAQDPVTVAAVYADTVDRPWVSRIHKAAQAAAARGEIAYAFTDGTAAGDYVGVVRGYAEDGHRLVLGQAFAVEDDVREASLDYPRTAFLMGSAQPPDPDYPNFSVFDDYIHDASYMSGIVSGSLTQTAKVGVVADLPVPGVNRLIHAFIAGVREESPNATFQIDFVDAGAGPDKAQATALAQIEAGADLVYAGIPGAADAAKARGVLAAGTLVDTQADYPDTVVASAIWHFEPTLAAAVKAVKGGLFEAKDYGIYSFMKRGGCSLAPLGTFDAKVSADAKKLVAEREAAIKEGSFEVQIYDDPPVPG